MSASSVFDMFLQYINHNYFLGILFLAAVICFIYKAFRAEKRQGVAALLAMVFLFLTVFNPLLYQWLSPIADNGSSYYRFIWTIPLVALTACFLTEIIFSLYRVVAKKISAKTGHSSRTGSTVSKVVASVTAILLCTALLFSSTTYLSAQNMTVPENKFSISRAALDISQFIQDDPDHTEDSVVLAPTEIMIELQAYDISLLPALPRDEYLAYGSGESQYEPLLSVVLEGASRNTEYMIWNLYSLDVDYIVCLTLFDLDPYMESIDYDVVNRTGDYTLYKRADDAHSFY